MSNSKLAAAVALGLVLGTGLGFVPAAGGMQPAVAEAAQAQVNILVDASRSSATVDSTGQVVEPSLTAALCFAQKQGAQRTVIRLSPQTFREKVVIDIPNLTLIGDSRRMATIVWDDAEGTPLRPGDTNGSKKTYTMECATVKITSNAKNFQAVNVTFANDFPTEARRADKKMKAVQAFAVTDEADKSSFYGCRFLGRQDTLYANAGRQYYRDCYIEGDVDFIFGQGTAVFDRCEIHSLDRKTKSKSRGYITAPSTLAQDKGFLFYRCHLTSKIKAPNYVLLGRPWHPSSEKREVNSAAVFRECQIDTPIMDKGWNSMKNKYGVFQPEDNRLYEYQNTGKYAVQGTPKGNRKQLTDKQAKAATPHKYLDGWHPHKRA